MDLSNEKTFEHYVLLSSFLMLIYIAATLYLLNRRGVNISSNRVKLTVLLTALSIGFLPFWLNTGLSWHFKVFVPLVSTIIGIFYGLGIMKTGKTIKSIINPGEKETKN